jgi:glutathione S-transferase
MLTLYRLQWSTNCERVEMALAHKGLTAESVWVKYDDRSAVRKVSGQDLVPVLVDDGRTVVDSMEIVRHIEERFPDAPRLYPGEPARRAECDVFVDWFNRVWKRPPNELESELAKPKAAQDAARVERLGRAMTGYLDTFEGLLTGRDYLLGDFSAADIAAFPFLKYASVPVAPDDDYLFHRILRDYQKPGKTHPMLLAWIARMDERPRI